MFIITYFSTLLDALYPDTAASEHYMSLVITSVVSQ